MRSLSISEQNNLIRFRIPQNAARLLAFQNGSAAAPTYSWNADPDIGMYRIGINTLGFATTGVERMRITAQGLVGVNSTAPTARLEVIAGGNIDAILGIADNANASGVIGWNSDNVSGTGTGVIGLGNGLTTIYTLVNGSGGAFTSDNVGVYGKGYANNAYGGYFVGGDAATGWTNNNVGAFGICGNGTNITADFVGVYGWANTTNSNYGYGVVGVGNWYGVFSIGDLGATGAKGFIIDHPLDPENKYLRHFAIESNEVLNLYRGVVTLDSKGEAIVTLPDYFTAINTNFSYQLTPIGAPMPELYISQEIDNTGTFKISGGVPGKKVAWVVYAKRNDLYFQHYPHKKEIEVLKKPHERGKYLMPELYGKPDSLGIIYRAPKATSQKELKLSTTEK